MLACQVAQSWPALCNPGSSVHGVLQARILEWVEAFGRGRVRRREEGLGPTLAHEAASTDCHAQEFGSIALPRPAAGSLGSSTQGPAHPFRKHSVLCSLSHTPS